MRKLIVAIPVLCLSMLLASFTHPGEMHRVPPTNNVAISEPATSSLLYQALQLESIGLSKKAFDLAYRGYQKLLKQSRISNPRYLTICDLSQSSRKRRLYLIDLVNKEVVLNTWVAHGRNSGGEFASRFSNRPSSYQSSLGFYVTMETYSGEHGLSLRMAGMEPGFNDRAYRRGVVVHGADYIGENCLQKGGRMGRSFGCPAVSKEESNILINTIKDGTCLFIYHPSRVYLQRSKILNG